MKNNYQIMTLDALNRMIVSANQMGWNIIVVGKIQYEEGKNITHCSAPKDYCMWDNVPNLGFKLEIVEGNYLGIKP